MRVRLALPGVRFADGCVGMELMLAMTFRVHAMVFNPKTGYIKRLNTFNAGEEIAVLGKYYDLYNVESAKQLWGDLDEYPKRTNAPTRQAAPVLSKGADAGALPGAPTEEEEAELAAAAAAVKTEE